MGFFNMIYKVGEKLVLLFSFPALRDTACVLDAAIDFVKSDWDGDPMMTLLSTE